MQGFEYRIVPAPKKPLKFKGIKDDAGRFAQTLTQLVNEMAQEGWEYLRADTLPCEERVGLTGRTTTFKHLLVFRRAVQQPAEAAPQPSRIDAARLVAAPAPALASHDPLDEAARRAALPLSAPEVPRLSSLPESGGAPALGPARAPGHESAKPR